MSDPRKKTKHPQGWTLVSKTGDVETSSDDGASTSSSSDFVDLSSKVVRYHHKDKVKVRPRSPPEVVASSEDGEDTAPPIGESRSSSTDDSEFEPIDAESNQPEEGEEINIADDEVTIATDNTDDPVREEAVTKGDLGADMSRSYDGDLDLDTPEEEEVIYPVGDNESDTPSVEVITPEEVNDLDNDLEDLSRSTTDGGVDSAEVVGPEAEVSVIRPEVETHMYLVPVPVLTELPSTISSAGSLNLRRQRQLSGSDWSSDSSDFVRLDPSLAEELPRAGDVMHSSSQSGSSISDNFRFVQPLHRGPNPYREEDEDSVSPEDVDDRCESDISGVAEDESDLSCMSYGIGDVPIDAGNVRRNCRHRPNSTLNGALTLLTLVTLFLAVGVGIGHYLGSQREAWLRSEQVAQLKNLQDGYLMCLREQDRLEQEALDPILERNKWETVTDIWKKKYEELLVEKVELEQQIQLIEVKHQGSLLSVHEDLSAMQTDLEELELQHSDNDNEKSLLQAQYEESSAKQELLTQQKIRLAQEKFVIQGQLAMVQEEKARLEIELMEMGEKSVAMETAQITDLNNKVGVMQLELLRLNEQKTSLELKVQESEDKRIVTEVDFSMKLSDKVSDNEDLRKQLNQLQIENTDLRAEVVKLRYSPHVQEIRTHNEVTENRLKGHVNELANENADLKVTVGKMRYRADETEPEPAPCLIIQTGKELGELKERLTEVTDELSREKARARLWETMFVADRVQQDNVTQGHHGESPQAPPSLSLCLSLLLPSINVTELMHKIGVTLPLEGMASFGAGVGGHVEFLRNLTHDIEFTHMLKRRWEEFRHYAEHPQVQNFVDEAVHVYQEMQHSMKQRWEQFTQCDEVKDVRGKVSKVTDAVVETVRGIHDNEKFRHVVDKTKESVAELSGRLADTWQKVKNLSNDFLDKHKETIESVQGTVSHIGQKMAKSVDKMHWKLRKHGSRWFNTRRHGDENNNIKASPSYHGHAQDHSSNAHAQTRWRQHRPGDSLVMDEESTNQKPQFEDKPNHKQKQSNHEQNYEEFWHSTGFDPDDLLHDGFFEGNQREWRKHQKRVKKLHGRIQRLNEQLFYSMDDDDIEDIYDDLDDLEDDLDDDHVPKRLQTWLTCQLRWWKSRFQRKHRNEEGLLKGCGQTLMRWQLRMMCKPCTGKKCAREGVGALCRSALKTAAGSSQSSDNGSHSDSDNQQEAQESPSCANSAHHRRHHRRHQQPQQHNNKHHGNRNNHSNPKYHGNNQHGNRKYHGNHKYHGNLHNHSNQKYHGNRQPYGNYQQQHPNGQERHNHGQQRDNKQPHYHGNKQVNSSTGRQRDAELTAKGATFNETFWEELVSEAFSDWFWRRTRDREDQRMDMRVDPAWYFRYMEDRETRRSDTSWLFQRAEERDMERSKDWYIRRMQERDSYHPRADWSSDKHDNQWGTD